MSDTGTVPCPALLTIKDLARLLKRSVVTLGRDHVSGRIPRGLKIGRSLRWDASEIAEWIAARCPPRPVWERMSRPAADKPVPQAVR